MKFDILRGGPQDLAVVTDGAGIVVAAGFADVDHVATFVPGGSELEPGDIGDVASRWRDYVSGDVRALDGVRVRQQGTVMQDEVWRALRTVPPGLPISYAAMADLVGRPRAARAVGSACGSNRIAPFVPCHRVIASDGGLGGYGYGLSVKQWLLDHEAHAVARIL